MLLLLLALLALSCFIGTVIMFSIAFIGKSYTKNWFINYILLPTLFNSLFNLSFNCLFKLLYLIA